MADKFRGSAQAVFLVCFGWLAPMAVGAVTFHLNFPDVTSHTGHYWDDPAHGAAARAEIQTRLNEFGAAFASHETVSLTIASTITTAFYASSGSATYQLQPSGFFDTAVYVKINTGVDLNGGTPEGTITFNFNFGHSAPSNFPDFISNIQGLTRHELIHLLGMTSFIGYGSNLARYDHFLFDSTNTPIANADGTSNPAANIHDAAIYFKADTGAHYVIAGTDDYSHLIGIMYPYKFTFDDADRAWLRTMGYVLAGDSAVHLTAIHPTLTLTIGAHARPRLVTTAVTGSIDGPVRYRLRGSLPSHLHFRTRSGRLVGTPTTVHTSRIRVIATYSVSGVHKQSAPVVIRLKTRP